jgi:hypothetical protein
MKVPLLCISIQPRSMAHLIQAPYWAAVPLISYKNGPLTFSDVDAPILNGFAVVRDLDQFAYFCCRSDSGLGSTNSTKSFSTES